MVEGATWLPSNAGLRPDMMGTRDTAPDFRAGQCVLARDLRLYAA